MCGGLDKQEGQGRFKLTPITTAARIPSLNDSTSISALSDSITTMDSPLATFSPSPLSQLTTCVHRREGDEIFLHGQSCGVRAANAQWMRPKTVAVWIRVHAVRCS